MNYPPRSDRSNSWKKPSRFGGPSSYNKGGFDRNADRPLFKAVCSDCGSRCEVPFKPNGKKPVLCNNCFKKDDAGSSNSFDKRMDRPRGFNDEKPSFDVDCDDCGVRTTVPFKPNGKKLVFCRDCFNKDENGAGGSSERPAKAERRPSGNEFQILDQLRAINLKLDTLMKLANKQAPPDEFDTVLE